MDRDLLEGGKGVNLIFNSFEGYNEENTEEEVLQ